MLTVAPCRFHLLELSLVQSYFDSTIFVYALPFTSGFLSACILFSPLRMSPYRSTAACFTITMAKSETPYVPNTRVTTVLSDSVDDVSLSRYERVFPG